MSQEKSFVANILVLGKTGVGKSSFINYFLGEEVEKVDVGKPVTKGTLHEHLSREGDIRIFDNEGFEALGAESQMNEIIEKIKQRNGPNHDVKGWFHTIFYCINMANARLEDAEVFFIQQLGQAISQHVHIILTHCDQVAPENIRRMREYIKQRLGTDEGFQIFEVVSRQWTKRNGEVIYPRGREAIRNSVFQLLWIDFSFSISRDYATEVIQCAKKYIDKIFQAEEKLIRKLLKLRSLLLIVTDRESELEKKLQPIQQELLAELERILVETNNKFDKILQDASELYVNYKGHFPDQTRFTERVGLSADDVICEWYHLDDILSDEAFTEGLLKTTLPNTIKLIEADWENEENALKFLGSAAMTAVKFVGETLTSGILVRRAIQEEKKHILEKLPSHGQIQKDVEDRLREFGISTLNVPALQ